MASNKDLRADIVALCAERSVAVPDSLESLNNGKLTELLESLRQQPVAPAPVEETALRPLIAPLPPEAEAAPAKPSVDEDKCDAPAATLTRPSESAATTGARGYFVAAGKTVTKTVMTSKELAGAFQNVHASDFAGGQRELDELLAAGCVFKR